jgi:hypothetical protein
MNPADYIVIFTISFYLKYIVQLIFSKNKIARLEQDFWARNKKKSKPLNKVEKILKEINR